jgi:hypothetical protein
MKSDNNIFVFEKRPQSNVFFALWQSIFIYVKSNLEEFFRVKPEEVKDLTVEQKLAIERELGLT